MSVACAGYAQERGMHWDLLYWGPMICIGIMDKKMETTIMYNTGLL